MASWVDTWEGGRGGGGEEYNSEKLGMKEEKREGESCTCGHHLLNWLLNALQYAGPYDHLLCFSYGTSVCIVCVHDKGQKKHVITRERRC